MISTERYNVSHAGDLSALLINDFTLRDVLGTSFDGTAEEFQAGMLDWIENNNAQSFSIVLSNRAVGLISICRIDLEQKTSQIGYWLASEYWNRGFMSKAFKDVLQEAAKLGIKTASATIDNNNIASQKLWRKYDFETEAMGEKKTKYILKVPCG